MLTAIAIVLGAISGALVFGASKNTPLTILGMALLFVSLYIQTLKNPDCPAKPIDTTSFNKVIDGLNSVEMSYYIDGGEYDR